MSINRQAAARMTQEVQREPGSTGETHPGPASETHPGPGSTGETHPGPGPADESPNEPSKRHDRLFTLAVGIICALLGAVASFGIPHLWSTYNNDKTTRVIITAPANNAQEPNNRFGASGIIEGPGTGEDASLWLVVYSGGGYYPYGALTVVDDQWHIPANSICTAVGFQSISVYEVPNKDSGPLWAYVQDASRHYSPIPGGLPRTAVLKATQNVEVNPTSVPGC